LKFLSTDPPQPPSRIRVGCATKGLGAGLGENAVPWYFRTSQQNEGYSMKPLCGSLSFSVFLLALSSCATPQGSSYVGPSGTMIHTVKCSVSPNGCFERASNTCSGSYQVVNSESHAGGLLADAFPGPVTWFGMTFECGPSDGKHPTFPLHGNAPAMPTYEAPTTTRCHTVGSSTTCTSN
jgi:hypothetical protein